MTAAVAHINLLQRTEPAHTTAWALAAVMVLTLLGGTAYGARVQAQAAEAALRRDDVARQLKDVQAQLAAANGEQERSVQSKSLRDEVALLEAQAQSARTLTDAANGHDGDDGGGFAHALGAMAGIHEPGLWLNAMTVSNGGKRVELQGDAGDGAAVLRFARHANQSLAPLAIRLENLEIMSPTGGTTPAAGGGAVSFRLN